MQHILNQMGKKGLSLYMYLQIIIVSKWGVVLDGEFTYDIIIVYSIYLTMIMSYVK